jgi:hypothetical protein
MEEAKNIKEKTEALKPGTHVHTPPRMRVYCNIVGKVSSFPFSLPPSVLYELRRRLFLSHDGLLALGVVAGDEEVVFSVYFYFLFRL